MNIVTWVQTNWLSLGTIIAGIHLILGVIGNLTGSKSVQGLDDVISNLIKTFFGNQNPPKS